MNRNRIAALAIVAASTLYVAAAQPPLPSPPPGMQAQSKAWQKWRSSHKNITAVEQTLRALDRMDANPGTRFTKAQAKKLLVVLKEWRHKPSMTDAQAKTVNRQLTEPLTTAQIKEIARDARTTRHGAGGPGGPGTPPPGGFGGPGPGGPPPGGPGGQRGPGSNPGAFPTPKAYNPLNPSTLPFADMRPMMAERIDNLMRELKARSK